MVEQLLGKKENLKGNEQWTRVVHQAEMDNITTATYKIGADLIFDASMRVVMQNQREISG